MRLRLRRRLRRGRRGRRGGEMIGEMGGMGGMGHGMAIVEGMIEGLISVLDAEEISTNMILGRLLERCNIRSCSTIVWYCDLVSMFTISIAPHLNETSALIRILSMFYTRLLMLCKGNLHCHN
jgi:hypothetical protein